MTFDRDTISLYAVTDRSWTGRLTLPEQVERALAGGVTCVQLREKALEESAFAAEARALLPLCHRYGAPLLINDNVRVALLAGADGVHVGQSDLPAATVQSLTGGALLLGVTARTVEQARLAEQCGADYLGVGAVFGSTTKRDARPLARETLAAICKAVSIPVCAIGGVTAENLPRLRGTGICGVAVVSALFSQPDLQAAAAELAAAVQALKAYDLQENRSVL